jgi:hypothetical protein
VKSLLSRRPSPALVIACLALFVSLSGVSYGVATGFIDSREIKNNEVRTKDLRNNDVRTRDLRNNEIRGIDIRNSTVQGRDIGINQVTGTDVRESTLQKVPSATAADTAASATSAASLGGLRVLPIKQRSGNVTNQVILNASGLQLLVSCAGGDEEPIARTTVAGGEISVISDDADTTDDPADVPQRAVNLHHNLDDTFNPGEDFDIRDVATAADDRMYEVHYLGGDGVSVTAHLITDDDLGASNCVVSGYAVVVP